MRTITVVGHGVSHAVPDVVVVELAAVHLARTLPEALSGAESARAAIVATARRFTDQVGSRGLSVGAEWNDAGRQDRYRARHSLLIRCTDLDQAGELVSALADEIGERLTVDHVGLEVGDPAEATRLAREAAFADARATAEHLAAQAGGALGQVENVSEGGAPGFGRVTAMAASSKVHFEAGETAVEQTLTVTFELL
jgi:uncharacterized protein YggE